MKLLKCEFGVIEVDFLEYCIGVVGISIDPRKVRTIMDWSKPKSYRDIQVFFRFTNFYRRFIYRYSAITALIIDLFIGIMNEKKKEPFKWTDGAKFTFRTLQTYFTTAPFLQHFDPNLFILLEIDASSFNIIVILL
jgi:hypothetical protein